MTTKNKWGQMTKHFVNKFVTMLERTQFTIKLSSFRSDFKPSHFEEYSFNDVVTFNSKNEEIRRKGEETRFMAGLITKLEPY